MKNTKNVENYLKNIEKDKCIKMYKNIKNVKMWTKIKNVKTVKNIQKNIKKT